MEITKKNEDGKMTLTIQGRLDTVTAPELQSELDALPAEIKDVTLDFGPLDYISSAGLRVLLSAHKKMMSTGGTLTIAGSNATVRDVFDMTGFSDILTLA